MKKITLFLIPCMLLLFFACTNSKQTDTPAKDSNYPALNCRYQNEYFSIDYPSGYEAYANFQTQPADGEDLKNMDSAATMDRPMNSLDIVPKKDTADWILPEVSIILSRNKLEVPIRAFMNVSIYMNGQPQDGLEPIGYSDIDSLCFAGYPALKVSLVYKSESGDTIVKCQTIVQKPDFSLYYLNNQYNYSHPETRDLGERILSTFKFKD